MGIERKANVTRDSVHLFVHETEASRILPTERNQLQPPTDGHEVFTYKYIYVYAIYISYFTVHNTSLRNHRRTKDQKSDVSPFFSPTRLSCSFHSSIANRDWLALPMVPPLPPMFSLSPDEWEILYKTMCTRWFRWELRERKKKRTTLLFCQISPSTWFRASHKSNHQQTIEV